MRRSLLALSLLGLAGCGGDKLSYDYDALRGGMSAAEASELPPGKDLRCTGSQGGLSKCEIELTELDGMKAARATYIFEGGKLMAAAIEYGPGAYAEVAKMMDKRYKAHASNTPEQGTWMVKDGVVISSPTELRHGNVYTYWLSTAEAAKAGVSL